MRHPPSRRASRQSSHRAVECDIDGPGNAYFRPLARLSQIRGYFLRRRAVNISWNTRAWVDETIDKLGTLCSMVTDTTARHDCCMLDAGTPDWSAKRQLKDANGSIARRSQEPCPA